MTMSRLNVCKRFYLTADCGKIRPWRSLLSFSLSSSLVYFHSGHIQSDIISKKLEGRCSFLLLILFLFSFLLRNLVLFFIHASLISAKEWVFFIFLNVFISYIFFSFFYMLGKLFQLGLMFAYTQKIKRISSRVIEIIHVHVRLQTNCSYLKKKILKTKLKMLFLLAKLKSGN